MSVEVDVDMLVEHIRETITKEVKSKSYRVPPLPQVAIELNAIASDPMRDLKDAVRVVERDPHLAGRILAVASSIGMGAWAQITNLRQAVVRVGANGLRDMALALMMGKVFNCGPLKKTMAKENERSYIMACACSLICRVTETRGGFGFLCGLLADVGRPALLATLSRLAGPRQREKMWLREDVALAAMDRLHADVGPLVIGRWDLHPVVKEVARFHHDPKQAEATAETEELPEGTVEMTKIVAAADAACDIEGDDIEALAAQYPEYPPIAEFDRAKGFYVALATMVDHARKNAAVVLKPE